MSFTIIWFHSCSSTIWLPKQDEITNLLDTTNKYANMGWKKSYKALLCGKYRQLRNGRRRKMALPKDKHRFCLSNIKWSALKSCKHRQTNRFRQIYVYNNICLVIITKIGGHEYERKRASEAENKGEFIYLYFIFQNKIKIQTFKYVIANF